MIKLSCLACCKPFSVDPYRQYTAKFCSRSCTSKYYFPSRQKSLLYDKHGENHPMWKGGKTLNSQGYFLIYSPKHPYKSKQGYVREHRLVMEKHLGRYLTKEEIVHHLNENKTDNRIENLQILTKKQHDIYHTMPRWFQNKPKIEKICAFCQKVFSVKPSLDRLVCCSQYCATKYRWLKGKAAFGH